MLMADDEDRGTGEVWTDLDHQWANECEHMYQLTKDWTDHMWKRTIEVDAPPQKFKESRRTGGLATRSSFTVMELHRSATTRTPGARSAGWP